MQIIVNGVCLEEVDKFGQIYKVNFRISTKDGEALFDLLIEIINNLIFRLSLNKNNENRFDILKLAYYDSESLAKEIYEKFQEPMFSLINLLVAILSELIKRRPSDNSFQVNYIHPAGIVFRIIFDLDYIKYHQLRQAIM